MACSQYTAKSVCLKNPSRKWDSTSGEILVVKKISVETQRNAAVFFLLNFIT